jgi:chemotaxis protein MotB
VRRRRARFEEPVKHERWLVSYADFITLLFAFFVVLFASSHRDAKKAALLSAAIHGAFQQLDAIPGDKAGQPNELISNAKLENAVSSQHFNRIASCAALPEAQYGSGIDVEQLRRELENALGSEIENHEIEIRLTPVGFVVSLKELGFFRSGEAYLLPAAVSKLSRIANILNQHGFEVRIEGHTDNVPIHTAEFRSNWELSTARATAVVRILIEELGFDPARVSVGGFGEYHPLDTNLTPEGRQRNRRVDLVVASHAETQSPPDPGKNESRR